MRHLVRKTTDLLATPTGPVVGTAFRNQNVDDTGEATATHTEIQRVGRPPAWVLTADLADLMQKPLIVQSFVAQCVAVEQIFNDSPLAQTWFASADVLIARAILLTGLENSGPKINGSDGTGPLQVTSDEWANFTAQAGAIGMPFAARPNDRLDSILQVWAAGYWMITACSALSEAVANARVAGGEVADPPYTPTGTDLALAAMLGTAAACSYVAVKTVRGPGTPVNEAFGSTDARRDAGRNAYPELLGQPGDASTIGVLDARIETVMNEGFRRAAALIAQDARDGAFVVLPAEASEGADGPPVRSSLGNTIPPINWQSLRDPLRDRGDVMQAVHSAFRNAGFSDAGSCALVAEVGRENDFQLRYLFGSHSDPANRARNTGFFSWQGGRATQLVSFLAAANVVGLNGSIKQGQDSLNAQAAFAANELKTMNQDLFAYLSNPVAEVDFERAARLLGTTYLKWRFYDPLYQRAHVRRRDYLQQILDLTAAATPGSAAIVVSPGGAVTRDAAGFFQIPGLIYDVKGKIRNKPVSGEYVSRLLGIVSGITDALAVKVLSAGQDPIGAPGARRTGSTRHDIDGAGLAHTSDFVLLRRGRPVRPGDDRALYENLLERVAAAGFPGIGHYEWGIHVGSGAKAAWGPNRTAGTLDPGFAAAIRRGWSRA